MKFKLIAILFSGLLLASCSTENVQSDEANLSEMATSLVESLTSKIGLKD